MEKPRDGDTILHQAAVEDVIQKVVEASGGGAKGPWLRRDGNQVITARPDANNGRTAVANIDQLWYYDYLPIEEAVATDGSMTVAANKVTFAKAGLYSVIFRSGATFTPPDDPAGALFQASAVFTSESNLGYVEGLDDPLVQTCPLTPAEGPHPAAVLLLSFVVFFDVDETVAFNVVNFAAVDINVGSELTIRKIS